MIMCSNLPAGGSLKFILKDLIKIVTLSSQIKKGRIRLYYLWENYLFSF